MNLFSEEVSLYFYDFLNYNDFLNFAKCRKIDNYKSIRCLKLAKMTDVHKWLIDNHFGENVTKNSTVTETYIRKCSLLEERYTKTYNPIEKIISNDSDSYLNFNNNVAYNNLQSFVNAEIFKKLVDLFGKGLITENSILDTTHNFYIFKYLLFNFNEKYDILANGEYFDSICSSKNNKIINYIISNVPRDHLICCLFNKTVLLNVGHDLFLKFVNATECYEELAIYNSCDLNNYGHMLERAYDSGGDISKIRKIFNFMIPFMKKCIPYKKFKRLIINDMFTDKFIKKMICY